MTDDEQSGFIEAHPTPSKQVLRPSDAGLSNLDRMAERLAREIGYSGAAYAMEVVHIQNRVFEMAKRGELRLYREDKPFPFVFGGLYEVDGGLRLCSADVQKVRAEFIGTTFAEPPQSSAQAVAPEAQPIASLPAVVSDSNCAPQDPERRLARLRSLGGHATYKRGEWKFKGIAALVKCEKNEGHDRRDEKTIRNDLREAAQNELDAKRAGVFDRLGQR